MSLRLPDLEGVVESHFDDSSLTEAGQQPHLVVIMGPVAAGKTTVRRQRYGTGHVLVDAAEIFIRLSAGTYYDFPSVLEGAMSRVAEQVADRAIAERRNVVTEIVGMDEDSAKALIGDFRSINYAVQVDYVDCDVDESVRRNAARGDDSVSAYYAEPYNILWLRNAARQARVR